MTDLKALQEEINSKLAEIKDPSLLESFRIQYLGRKGKLADLFREMGTLSSEEKPRFGQLLNQLAPAHHVLDRVPLRVCSSCY